MNSGNTLILACSSLKDYVEEAQRIVKTSFRTVYLNRIYHRDPKEMRSHVLEALSRIPDGITTVLVCMGFCGGSWENVCSPCRLVMPKVDDCVSLLLQTGDSLVSDLKEPGHLYVREKDPTKESFRSIFERLTQNIDDETGKRYHADWVRLYSEIDIMDTGINNCRTEQYRSIVQADADWLQAKLSYVGGGTHLLEKLFSGNWDEQFLIVEANETIRKDKVLGFGLRSPRQSGEARSNMD